MRVVPGNISEIGSDSRLLTLPLCVGLETQPVELGGVLVPLDGVEFILAQVEVATEGGGAAHRCVDRYIHRFHLDA